MANALSAALAPPAAPMLPQQQPQNGEPMQQAPAPVPAPTHEQVVAGLRHFGAILSQFEQILKDPELGKSDVKSKIIDGVTKLVSDGMMDSREAVTQLGTVPTDPLEQMKWIRTHFNNAILAENAILDHHVAAHRNVGGSLGADMILHPVPKPENHLNAMKGLMGHYRGGGSGLMGGHRA